MDKRETLIDFYQRKFDWVPSEVRNELGHFNVFRLEAGKQVSMPYRRRDFYKVMLVRGHSRIHYADRVLTVKHCALSFSNPQIPYKWDHLDSVREGAFCIFNRQFFHHFGNLNQYSVFQPTGEHLFELTAEQAAIVAGIFECMLEEIDSDYVHKYDLLRNLVFELLHFALKTHPAASLQQQTPNAAQRIGSLFLELLERQFPIEESHPQVNLRTPADFARQLNIHVNHLNRAVKQTTQKTTSHLIAERLMQEAHILLKHSHWNVSEIAYALGFGEVAHFNHFFKKHSGTNPTRFRSGN